MTQKPYIVEQESVWKVPAIIMSIAVAIPVGAVLWRAVEALSKEMLRSFGTIFLGSILLFVILGAGVLLTNWVRQPGQQLPDSLQFLERGIEK